MSQYIQTIEEANSNISSSAEHCAHHAEYTQELFFETDYPEIDVNRCLKIIKKQIERKKLGMLKYKDYAYESVVTGVMAVEPRRPWLEIFDNENASFMDIDS